MSVSSLTSRTAALSGSSPGSTIPLGKSQCVTARSNKERQPSGVSRTTTTPADNFVGRDMIAVYKRGRATRVRTDAWAADVWTYGRVGCGRVDVKAWHVGSPIVLSIDLK